MTDKTESPKSEGLKPEALRPPPAGRDIGPYLEARLGELADLATVRGKTRLAVAIQMAALEAARDSG